MKIKCPNCDSSFNIDDEKISIEVTNLKCTKCEFTFIVNKENVIDEGEKSKDASGIELTSDTSKAGVSEEEKWIKDARQLAEVIVSDIRIYNKDKISECKTDQELALSLSAELKKGRDYYLQKINPNLKEPNKYYAEAVRKFLKIKSSD